MIIELSDALSITLFTVSALLTGYVLLLVKATPEGVRFFKDVLALLCLFLAAASVCGFFGILFF